MQYNIFSRGIVCNDDLKSKIGFTKTKAINTTLHTFGITVLFNKLVKFFAAVNHLGIPKEMKANMVTCYIII